MNKLTIKAPDDWHLHFRDGELLQDTVAATSRCFRRAIVMPNLVPPVTNKELALAYRERIVNAVPNGDLFQPLMTLYLTNQTSANDIHQAFSAEIPAAKLYPAGATTNSDAGVGSIDALFPVFQAMSDVGMLLLIHGEVTDPSVDIFDREKQFIDDYLGPIHQQFPALKIVFEHITTADAADFVEHGDENLAATITPQHLLLNRNDLFVGGIRPHNYCLPVLKRNNHQQRLQEAVASGSKKFFLGTDSAPHTKHMKENACGCAGCYSAWSAIELYTHVFDQLGALHHLEGFASLNGPRYYGLPENQDSITLTREPWTIPEKIRLSTGDDIVPFFAGQTIDWQIIS